MDVNSLFDDIKIKNVIEFNVNKFKWAFDSVEDARQEAYLFAWETAQKFDSTKNCSISTFLNICLRRKFINMANRFVQDQACKYNSKLVNHLNVTNEAIDSYDINELLKFLDCRTRNFIYEYYFNRRALREIGKLYGVSIERARQVISQGIKHLNFLLNKDSKHGPRSSQVVGT